MACSGCRQPKEIRKPSVPRTPSSGISNPISRNTGNSTGNQRSRITGLTYVPK